MIQEQKLEADEKAGERTCENEVCGCVLADAALTDFCSEYCAQEGVGRGDGVCQCGHIGCA
jgi:hypothetical protein